MPVSSFPLRNSPENPVSFMPPPNSFLRVFLSSPRLPNRNRIFKAPPFKTAHEDKLAGHCCLMISDHHYNRFSQKRVCAAMLKAR